MATENEEVYEAIDSLLCRGIELGFMEKADTIYLRNCLLSLLKLDGYENPQSCALSIKDALVKLCDFAVMNGLIEDSQGSRDLFDTALMGAISPLPSAVCAKFYKLYEKSPKEATDWFYKLSQDLNYIRRDRLEKDHHFTADTKYGRLELSINLSKPEKDPKDIAKAKLAPPSAYPKCLLCRENEGYAGHINHPARQNLRLIPVKIGDEDWSFQYSPYVYYNEHCIVLSPEHRPMLIDGSVFGKLFDFLDIFPHYFIGSNADLPIVGGSILSHEHFQGGRHEFPMARAKTRNSLTVEGFENIDCQILDYPMSVIRMACSDRKRLEALASKLLCSWRNYTDKASMIYAETYGTAHNTITPIARRRGGKYELDLVLRNNLTTNEHPLGLYHPHEQLHHIKKENIGLIEVMGLAVLPARLNEELGLLEEMLISGKDPSKDSRTAKHALWAKGILARHPEFSSDKAGEIIRQEVGAVFAEVLECAGVFKTDGQGQRAFLRFCESFGAKVK